MLGFELYAWWQYRAQTIAYVDELPVGERLEFDEALRRNYGSFPVENECGRDGEAKKSS
jgi:hypothetical protein